MKCMDKYKYNFYFRKEKNNKMAYDDILLYLGEFGPYQRRIYLLLCLPAIVCALHKLGGVFLMAKAENRLVIRKKNNLYKK